MECTIDRARKRPQASLPYMSGNLEPHFKVERGLMSPGITSPLSKLHIKEGVRGRGGEKLGGAPRLRAWQPPAARQLPPSALPGHPGCRPRRLHSI